VIFLNFLLNSSYFCVYIQGLYQPLRSHQVCVLLCQHHPGAAYHVHPKHFQRNLILIEKNVILIYMYIYNIHVCIHIPSYLCFLVILPPSYRRFYLQVPLQQHTEHLRLSNYVILPFQLSFYLICPSVLT